MSGRRRHHLDDRDDLVQAGVALGPGQVHGGHIRAVRGRNVARALPQRRHSPAHHSVLVLLPVHQPAHRGGGPRPPHPVPVREVRLGAVRSGANPAASTTRASAPGSHYSRCCPRRKRHKRWFTAIISGRRVIGFSTNSSRDRTTSPLGFQS